MSASTAVSNAQGPWQEPHFTAALVLADGTVIKGFGIGHEGMVEGELCFNTAMTGYQEILTDPSYAGQIITFTFPHIGNVGANDEDIETTNLAASSGVQGCVFKADISEPSNYRAAKHFDQWLKSRQIVGLCGIDTRTLTAHIREKGMQNAVICHAPDGKFDENDLKTAAFNLKSLEGQDLVPGVSTTQRYDWDETPWVWGEGFGHSDTESAPYKVVALDFGAKRNILRLLTNVGCAVTVVPATTTADDILAMSPDGIFLANGPGDPAATGEYSVGEIKQLIDSGKPIFGICLGHQMLGLALGAKTKKMHQGHHGANHPVKDHTTGKVEITSMNHGFALDAETFPEGITETHVSLFDGSNCGLAVDGKPIFSVQHHPEASPGPQDSYYLFERFANAMKAQKS
ncbi:MAG: glutamine-hydrolyzing carbamoyl-phosphate synthase small subunit [Hyphomicrobiales bacterium]